MSDNLPNQNNPNPWDTPQSVTPADPSNPSIPPTPPNNTVDPVQSWVAQHEQRDASGKFVSSDHLTNGQSSQTTPNSPNTQNIPSPVSFTQNNKYSEKNDPPLVAVSVTNPVTYLKLFLKRLLKNEGIDIRLKIKPLTVIACVLALSTAFSAGFNVAAFFFPNSSPIFHRQVSYQGTIQKNQIGGYFLILPDSSLWKLKPKFASINLEDLVGKQTMIQGNLTREPNLIEVSQVIPLSPLLPRSPVPLQPTPTLATGSAQPSL